MGFMSRKVVPACSSMCICCPALRSRSRQPVKRYKKLVIEIFNNNPSPDDDRKIIKLCEYASKNPFRIPKITHYLHHKIYKQQDLFVTKIAIQAFHQLLHICKHQILYFAANLLNVIEELLDNANNKQDDLRILGCQTLTSFVYSQEDATYAHNIDLLVRTVCMMARDPGNEHNKRCPMRASSLQCVSSMVWFMAEFSYIFTGIDDMVHVTLDNYEPGVHCMDDDGEGLETHNWVQEVVKSETRGVAHDFTPTSIVIRPCPQKKDPSLLTRDEIETPKVWAQICIQRLSDLVKENTTMRRVLDPMFTYFDSRRLWVPRQGLATVVLSDMFYFMEGTGREQSILSAIIRHLDHKNVAHDHRVKADIIQIVAALVHQFRSKVIPVEAGIVEDLCRHLRRSLQVTVALTGEQDISLNIALHNSIEECLLQLTKEVGGTQPLFDVMIFALENHMPVGLSARETTVFMLTLARIVSSASACSPSRKVFPEALLFQLLKTMIHPDAETRILAHQIFSVLLVPTYSCPRHELMPFKADHACEPKSSQSKSLPVYASAAALLQKLRREKDGIEVEKHVSAQCDLTEKHWRNGWNQKRSLNFCTLSSTIDKTVPANGELDIIKLSEDQIAQLLSSFWIQACLPDNIPSNFEAISRSFNLTLVSSYPRSADGNLVKFFQLPSSIRSFSVDLNDGRLLPSCRRSLFLLATAMLMSAARMYQIPHLSEILEASRCYDVDPFVGIGDDQQVHVKSGANLSEYRSDTDDETVVSQLRECVEQTDESIRDVLVGSLPSLTKLDKDELRKQLSEAFRPDDSFMFVPQSWHVPMESLSFDGDLETSESGEGESEVYCIPPKRLVTTSHVLSVGQLLESALEKAGEMAGTAVSTSPLGFSTMAWQCEALGSCTRKKLGNWLDGQEMTLAPVMSTQVEGGRLSSGSSWSTMRLPPASPFDNFLRAVNTR
ncbi:hypothetical protein ACHQM5_025734 [Ranunculus cassubicifolius]